LGLFRCVTDFLVQISYAPEPRVGPFDMDDIERLMMDTRESIRSEVVRDRHRFRARNDKLLQLRAIVELGLADAKAGRTKPLTDDPLCDIAERGRQLAESRKTDRS
jgi:hypothetical protein